MVVMLLLQIPEILHNEKKSLGAGKNPQWLRALASLPKDQSSTSSTHVFRLQTIFNFSMRGFDVIFRSLLAYMEAKHPYTYK